MSYLTLSWRVPPRTNTLRAAWCRKNFTTMTQEFRNIRAKFRDPMNCCFICKRQFEDGDPIALACFEKHNNKALCGTCADKLLASAPKEDA